MQIWRNRVISSSKRAPNHLWWIALLVLGVLSANSGSSIVSEFEIVRLSVATQDPVDRPPSGDEREERDESGLPDDAFNPMKLYRGEGTKADGESEGYPKFDPLEKGVVRWPYLTVHVNEGYVDIEGVVGINDGFLEQVACTPGTRGYESLVIAFAQPSHIHAALLLLGLEPGKPGKWEAVAPAEEGGKLLYRVVGPEGAKVRVTVIYDKLKKRGTEEDEGEGDPSEARVGNESGGGDGNGEDDGDGGMKAASEEETERVEVPVFDWIIDYKTGKRFPAGVWIFGGSRIRKDFTGVERYVADLSGSIVGLVTFGDELLGWNEVWPDEEEVLEPEWICNTAVMPAWNSRVTLRIRGVFEKGDDAAAQGKTDDLRKKGGAEAAERGDGGW